MTWAEQLTAPHAGKQASVTGMGNTLMELRKCCNHPYLLTGLEDSLASITDRQAALSTMVEASGKLELVDRMLGKLIERGHRVLLYSQFTTVLDVLEDWLNGRGWGYQRIDGSVSKSLLLRKGETCKSLVGRGKLLVQMLTHILYVRANEIVDYTFWSSTIMLDAIHIVVNSSADILHDSVVTEFPKRNALHSVVPQDYNSTLQTL